MLGQKIADLRKRKGMSQELLAEHSRLSLRTIQRIETGASEPRPYTLKVIADALSVSLDEINIDNKEAQAWQKGEWATIGLINLSCMAVVILPLLNILIPLIVWRRHNHLPMANIVGRRILSFQILWTIVSFLMLAFYQLVQMAVTGSSIIGRIPVVVILYVLLVAINVAFIVYAAIRVKNQDPTAYAFVPALL
jgi:XRE family transcriptional regulator, regulator of sulfur utilization